MAASLSVWGEEFVYWKRPVSVTIPTYRQVAMSWSSSTPSVAANDATSSAVDDALGFDHVEVGEFVVAGVVVDVDQTRSPAGDLLELAESLDRSAVDGDEHRNVGRDV